MIFSNRSQNSKARIIMPIGMMCLALGLSLPRVVHPSAGFGPDLMDGVEGVLLGVAIGLNLWSVVLLARERRCGPS